MNKRGKKLKILMLGWEFPPFNMGGLGTACYAITKELVNNNHKVIFVLPKMPYSVDSHVELIGLNNLEFESLEKHYVDSLIYPYIDSKQYSFTYEQLKMKFDGNINLYGKNLYQEVINYSKKIKEIIKNFDFDVIHAHDWLTYLAGIEVKKLTHKPLIVHVHATEFDRTGNNPNPMVYDIELNGMKQADKVIAVSNFTKQKIIEHYDVDPKKIVVIHNAVDFGKPKQVNNKIKDYENIVLFLGRLTLQKGPEYFVYTAKKILEFEPNTKFIVAGTGDKFYEMIELVNSMNLSKNFLFTGFLRGEKLKQIYSMADVYVMPSVSEPFGITPLESISAGTPVVISKQSGVSEVLNHCFKVDFWDIDEMTNKIVGLLRYKELHSAMIENSQLELNEIKWQKQVKKLINVYEQILNLRN